MDKENRKEYQKQYRQSHKEYFKQWRKDNSEYIKEYNKQWRNDNLEYEKNRNQNPMRRAYKLVHNYCRKDEKYNRGECTLTPHWIVDNIFTKSCIYCGETDWRKLGCDRIDNEKPHTLDNVVPCCKACNDKRGSKDYNEFKTQL